MNHHAVHLKHNIIHPLYLKKKNTARFKKGKFPSIDERINVVHTHTHTHTHTNITQP